MADAAGARLIVPVHHQSFRLSNEPFMEPIERIQEALAKEQDRLALPRDRRDRRHPELTFRRARVADGGVPDSAFRGTRCNEAGHSRSVAAAVNDPRSSDADSKVEHRPPMRDLPARSGAARRPTPKWALATGSAPVRPSFRAGDPVRNESVSKQMTVAGISTLHRHRRRAAVTDQVTGRTHAG